MPDLICALLDESFESHVIHHLHRLEEFAMTQSDNQTHLATDVTALGAAVATIVSELKAQAAAGQPLDFTAADALVASTQAEATADAPPVVTPPSPTPAPADPNQPPTPSA